MPLKILISNDDGHFAPGIHALYRELKKVADVTMVAPLEERSTTGHTLTLDAPLRLVKIEDNIFGCSGYPADCVYLGLEALFKDEKPDIVISGINRGANLGQDVYYSGTVAAAREAVVHGIPAIAVSTVVDYILLKDKNKLIHFETAARIIKSLVERNIHLEIPPRHLLNINVPDLPYEEIKALSMADIGFRNYSTDVDKRRNPRGQDYYWIGGVYNGFEDREGTDCSITAQAKASVSLLNIFHQSSDKREGIEQWLGSFNL